MLPVLYKKPSSVEPVSIGLLFTVFVCTVFSILDKISTAVAVDWLFFSLIEPGYSHFESNLLVHKP
jgi:hypothetical protein